MGSCIICGAPADGQICKTHEEDVVFEFKGTKPDELTPGRFYRGTVDGIAEFGVFVDIGDHVTGLLHKSELDRRLENLDWDRGDTVYVQVTSIRDNGNIDLGWSIRQSEREFRGSMVDDPTADGPTVREPDDEGEDNAQKSDGGVKVTPKSQSTSRDEGTVQVQEREEDETTDGAGSESPTRVEVDSLSDRVGERIRLEGTIVGVRQTGGPTVFEVRDESGVVSCAAFEEAGVRAYPDVDIDDVVGLDGTVEMHHNELQVETERLDVLQGDERAAVEGRLEDAITAKARPEDVELLAELDGTAAIHDEIRDAAEAIRRAVIESRPVIVRHDASADGYLAGAAIERAVLPLVREEHAKQDAEYHYFDRRPLGDRFYDMDAATGDATSMLDNRERHDEKLPLFVLINAGSTEECRDGLSLLDIYGAPRVVIDTDYPDEDVAGLTDVTVNPYLGDEAAADEVTTGALGGDVAAHVNPDIRGDLAHLPAASYWADGPEAYVDLAADAGYDETDTDEIREAIALEAYYQSYEDKRELVADILWDDESGDLAAYVSEQFRSKLETELDTVEPNLERREEGDVTFTVLDTDAFTHRFDFPSTDLLLDEIHRRKSADESGVHVTLGIADDEVFVRSTDSVDIRAIAEDVKAEVPDGGVHPKGARNGRIEFLMGERDAVVDAVVSAIADAR